MKPHQPVLLESVLEVLSPRRGESYLDLTAGYGGHASSVLELTQNYKGAVLVDRDQAAVDYLRDRFADATALGKPAIIHDDFYSAALSLLQCGNCYDLILMDLGVSSPQLDLPERGFSFRGDGPLDMRMDQRSALSALEVINGYPERQLAQLIENYGEESRGRAAKIARAIVTARPLRATGELAALVAGLFPARGRIHPATQTFQALRIEVNQELRLLEETLPLLRDLLNPAGRVAIISFHSLEDRRVKHYLKEASTGLEARLRLLTKNPIIASDSEIVQNPRSRSAKLRAAVAL